MSVADIGSPIVLVVLVVVAVILVRRGRRMAAQSPQTAASPAQAQVVAHTAADTGAADRTNSLAILALVFGILGGYLAIIFGHIALSQIKRTGEQGRGLAIAGLILGYFWVAVSLIILIGVIIQIATGG